MTTGVSELIQRGVFDAVPYLQRHLNGDWGDLGDDDQHQNDAALKHGDRLLSSCRCALYDPRRWLRHVIHRATTDGTGA